MKTKKLIVTILIFAVILIITMLTNIVDAASLGYVTITKDRAIERNNI